MTLLTDLLGSGGGGITPPKAAKGIIAGDAYPARAHKRPMPVVEAGGYLEYNSTTFPIYLKSNIGATVWTISPSAIMTGGAWQAIYWDKIEGRLYVLVTNGVIEQFAWLEPTTGAVFSLGATWTPTAGLAVASVSSNSLSRIGGQGSGGDFVLHISTTTGMANMTIPAAGGSGAENVNITVGGSSSKLVASYKVDTDLYIGGIGIQDGAGVYTGSTAYAHQPNQNIALVTPKVQSRRIVTDFKFGVGGAAGNPVFPITYVNEWGGDIIICVDGSMSHYRMGATLYDKADFHRWVKDIDNLYCGGTW